MSLKSFRDRLHLAVKIDGTLPATVFLVREDDKIEEMVISDEKLVDMYEEISGERIGENVSRRVSVIKGMRGVVMAKDEQEAGENFDLWDFETEDALIAFIQYVRGGGCVLDAKAED